ncbi:hypothetical protein Pan44_39920 [Caulifigura coniformis]|uniref:Uncharacterized protein n=1 Tax=Caulifigura coniformis TaxID=2527983 RepID=A0A517SII4_9PLAN|nr:hypothetical protein Pan44_39920 [Caulifigura coniformis]
MKTTGRVTKKLALRAGTRGKKVAGEPVLRPAATTGRVPRITKLMALAIKFDQMIRDGVVKDQAELARLGFVTRARVTQIMNLLNLAAPIQESLLSIALPSRGRDRITERQLRRLLEFNEWSGQSSVWSTLANVASWAQGAGSASRGARPQSRRRS